MSKTEKMLEKVRALLAQAESTTFAEEAETFTEKAQELMARYAIDEAMLAHAEQRQETIGVATIVCEAPYATAKASLLHAVSRANSCRSIRLSSRGTDASQQVKVYGVDSDLRWVETLYTSLLVQAATQVSSLRPERSMHWWKSDVGPGDVRAYRRAFMLGFAGAISERLEAANRSAQRESAATPGMALVLADKNRLVEDAFNAAHPNRSTSRSSTVSAAGFNAGKRAGQNANLARSSVGGERPAVGR